MREVIQSSETNPAFISPYKFTFAFPSASTNYYNSAFPFKELGTIENEILTLSPVKAINSLDENSNLFQGNLNASLGSINFRFKDLQFRIFHNSNADMYAYYPKKLLELIWYGNGEFVGEEIEIAPQIDFNLHHEYGLGFAIQVNETLSIGTNLKYLSGIFSFKTQNSQASLYTDEAFYQLTAKTDLMFYSSGLSDFLNGNTEDLIVYNDFGNYILNQNSGFAIDLGFNSKVSDRFSFAMSVLDLGFINWRETTYQQYSQGEFEFDGVEVQAYNDNDDYDFENVLDSIDNLIDFESSIMSGGYKTNLPMRFYLSGNWNLPQSCTLGVLGYGELYRGNFNPAIAINAQKNFKHYFGIGTLVGLRKNKSVNVGFNTFLRFGGVQLYGMTDNVLSLFNFQNGHNTNFRIGLNLAFLGKPKTEQEEFELDQIKEESEPAESLKEPQLSKKEIRKLNRANKKKQRKKTEEKTPKKKNYFGRTYTY